MNSAYSRLHVFIIADRLDILRAKILSPGEDYHSYFTSLSDLEDTVARVDNENKKHNINLILIHGDSAAAAEISRINSVFTEKNGLARPSFLFLSPVRPAEAELEKIVNAQNYFYLIPKECDSVHSDTLCCNLHLLVKFIFHKIESIERLNDYIVSSFETIVDSAIITRQKCEIESLNAELNAMSRTDFLTKVLNRRAFFEKMEEEKKRALRDNWRILNAKTDFFDENAKDIAERRAAAESAASASSALSAATGASELSASAHAVPDNRRPAGMLLEHFGRFSCILLDIDHFKLVNDNYGHLKGDEVLKSLGEAMSARNIFRENDVLARYGGEEFIILLPGTSREHAKIPAERFREYVKSLVFLDESKKEFGITISLGISEYRSADATNEELINRADQALYYAKEHGRDQVVVYDEVFPEP